MFRNEKFLKNPRTATVPERTNLPRLLLRLRKGKQNKHYFGSFAADISGLKVLHNIQYDGQRQHDTHLLLHMETVATLSRIKLHTTLCAQKIPFSINWDLD